MAKFINKKSSYIGKNVKLGKNVVVYPNNFIDGNSKIGDNSVLMPGNYITNSVIESNCKIQSSNIDDSVVESGSVVGPFARIRPGTNIGKNCKIGNFVEIKNSQVGDGSKISHLAYVGDSQIGKNCNVGCGVIFANYSGKAKNKIFVGDHVFIGSNSNLIAPVEIQSNSYICAGTTVTEKVNSGDFVIGRAKQINKPDRAKKYF